MNPFVAGSSTQRVVFNLKLGFAAKDYTRIAKKEHLKPLEVCSVISLCLFLQLSALAGGHAEDGGCGQRDPRGDEVHERGDIWLCLYFLLSHSLLCCVYIRSERSRCATQMVCQLLSNVFTPIAPPLLKIHIHFRRFHEHTNHWLQYLLGCHFGTDCCGAAVLPKEILQIQEAHLIRWPRKDE
jgi:hypothetical protein